jgi:hypothetical protein
MPQGRKGIDGGGGSFPATDDFKYIFPRKSFIKKIQ